MLTAAKKSLKHLKIVPSLLAIQITPRSTFSAFPNTDTVENIWSRIKFFLSLLCTIHFLYIFFFLLWGHGVLFGYWMNLPDLLVHGNHYLDSYKWPYVWILLWTLERPFLFLFMISQDNFIIRMKHSRLYFFLPHNHGLSAVEDSYLSALCLLFQPRRVIATKQQAFWCSDPPHLIVLVLKLFWKHLQMLSMYKIEIKL